MSANSEQSANPVPSAAAGTRPMSKVLIANRGEIAVRIIRAARDEGLASVAVYADPDRDALHVRLADEAYALGGNTAAESYLVMDKLIEVAHRSGADAIHPGYGFLAENAEFAAKVIDAGITWIGPSPAAISALGDKVQARHIAEKVGAPQVPGTADPVESAEEILEFVDKFGLPVAIKAAFGGGGRGIKVARTREEIPELFESAVREAVAAFGRGECFIERFLDAPRHVETQCLADAHGNVVVVSTRDCSLQRRNQKLVEEAPAPFLTAEQNQRLYDSSKAILKEAGYLGAGTCEFLVGQDGTISFLEVNTRLQVEHCVSEEVTGIDLVREQFRLARGEELGYGDPEVRGHSIEFRITGEDPGRNFMPAPGTITGLKNPTGPGIRIDSGVEQGDVISGNFDSMLSKLIVTGATRAQALQRSRRALEEMVVEGIPTVIPFDLAVVTNPDFAPAEGPFKVHTRWIETAFVNDIPAWTPTGAGAEESDAGERQRVVVEVGGKRLEVVLPASLGSGTGGGSTAKPAKTKKRARTGGGAAAASGNALTSPMQGTIVKVAVSEGARGRRRRPRRRARSHEDGAAAHRAPRRHHHRARGSARRNRLRGCRDRPDRGRRSGVSTHLRQGRARRAAGVPGPGPCTLGRVKPFLLLASRAEDDAAEDEYHAYLRYGGLTAGQLRRIRMEADPLPELDLNDYSGVIVGGSPFTSSDPEEEKSAAQKRVERELAALLDRIVGADFPFLGACYGVGTLGLHQGAVIDRTFGEGIGGVTIRADRRGPAGSPAQGHPRTLHGVCGPQGGLPGPARPCRAAGRIPVLPRSDVPDPQQPVRHPVPSGARRRRPDHPDRHLPPRRLLPARFGRGADFRRPPGQRYRTDDHPAELRGAVRRLTADAERPGVFTEHTGPSCRNAVVRRRCSRSRDRGFPC